MSKQTIHELIIQHVRSHLGLWPHDDKEAWVVVGQGQFKVTKKEFDEYATHMGYVNGYLWGVTHSNNQNIPDIPDGVEFWYNNFCTGHNQFSTMASEVTWHCVNAFKITDEKYKPKTLTNEAESLGIQPPPNKSELREMEYKESNWFERGERPPVNTVAELKPYWHRVKVVAHDEDKIVFWDYNERNYSFCCCERYFRPVSPQREKTINAAISAAIIGGDKKVNLNPCVTFAIERLYDAGLLRLPEDKS
jgi:hypothetical protein